MSAPLVMLTFEPHQGSRSVDLMGLARPAVDERALRFLKASTIQAGDFTRVSDGSCHLHPQLGSAVVAACGVLQRRVVEHASWLRTLLLE
jgi:hypothetical protein